MYSSIRPSSARISSVGGCVVEARGLSSTFGCASSSVTSWPKRAQASAATAPTGPAPTTRILRRGMVRGDYTEPMHRLGARQAAGMIERGELTAEKLVRSCLERISRRDAEVKAWVCLHPDAMAQANAAQGPLRGVPVGVKDIFDTHDLPTEYGSRVYTGYRPRTDSAPVAVTRRAGGTILGKTVTAEFATFVPGATRNPHDLKRTPGGSSSGSAAAGAELHVSPPLCPANPAIVVQPPA